ncbi:hypothetical protein MIDIC_340016 [Alphaproteobacteria bacterium]
MVYIRMYVNYYFIEQNVLSCRFRFKWQNPYSQANKKAN